MAPGPPALTLYDAVATIVLSLYTYSMTSLMLPSPNPSAGRRILWTEYPGTDFTHFVRAMTGSRPSDCIVASMRRAFTPNSELTYRLPVTTVPSDFSLLRPRRRSLVYGPPTDTRRCVSPCGFRRVTVITVDSENARASAMHMYDIPGTENLNSSSEHIEKNDATMKIRDRAEQA